MRKVGITGRNGFIGSALSKRLVSLGQEVYSYPRPDLDVLYLFGSPSSQVLFDKNMDYCFLETINSFLFAVKYCKEHKIKLVYPSSGTVYNKNNAYSRCKAILEEIHRAYATEVDILGFRIFAGYGVGEAHKGEYASVIYKWCEQIKNGQTPIIYGDGTQTRDFVYIDDIIDYVVELAEIATGVFDIGSGKATQFNHVLSIINQQLKTKVKPLYAAKPKNYIDDTICEDTLPTKVSLQEGIRRICESLS